MVAERFSNLIREQDTVCRTGGDEFIILWNYLKKFPINKLKIDQSFVFDVLTDEDDDEAIDDAVITLARSLGLKTLAKGVETDEHLRVLKNKDCDFMQGYLFSKPVPAEQFVNLLNHPPLGNLGVD